MQIPFLGIQAESQTVSFRGRLTNLSAFQGGTWGGSRASQEVPVFRSTPAIIPTRHNGSTPVIQKNCLATEACQGSCPKRSTFSQEHQGWGAYFLLQCEPMMLG